MAINKLLLAPSRAYKKQPYSTVLQTSCQDPSVSLLTAVTPWAMGFKQGTINNDQRHNMGVYKEEVGEEQFNKEINYLGMVFTTIHRYLANHGAGCTKSLFQITYGDTQRISIDGCTECSTKGIRADLGICPGCIGQGRVREHVCTICEGRGSISKLNPEHRIYWSEETEATPSTCAACGGLGWFGGQSNLRLEGHTCPRYVMASVESFIHTGVMFTRLHGLHNYFAEHAPHVPIEVYRNVYGVAVSASRKHLVVLRVGPKTTRDNSTYRLSPLAVRSFKSPYNRAELLSGPVPVQENDTDVEAPPAPTAQRLTEAVLQSGLENRISFDVQVLKTLKKLTEDRGGVLPTLLSNFVHSGLAAALNIQENNNVVEDHSVFRSLGNILKKYVPVDRDPIADAYRVYSTIREDFDNGGPSGIPEMLLRPATLITLRNIVGEEVNTARDDLVVAEAIDNILKAIRMIQLANAQISHPDYYEEQANELEQRRLVDCQSCGCGSCVSKPVRIQTDHAKFQIGVLAECPSCFYKEVIVDQDQLAIYNRANPNKQLDTDSIFSISTTIIDVLVTE